MSLRIGFDMDGVLADFAQAFHDVERRLFATEEPVSAEAPEVEDEREIDEQENARERIKEARAQRRRRDAVWAAIRATPNFWTTLKPLDVTAVRRIRDLMLVHRWEVFFITQRPATDGDTVQRQTQRWLVEQGFDWPSVLVIHGSRGAAAAALRLDYHVDDSAQNCLDVKADSGARPILILGGEDDEATIASARKLGIGTARTIGEALDILEQASLATTEPGLLTKLAALVGWR